MLDAPLEPITELTARGITIPEPQWDKEASVQTWLTNALAIAIAVLGATDPGFRWPTWTHAAIPVISGVIASFAHWLILKKAARRAQLAGARAVAALGV